MKKLLLAVIVASFVPSLAKAQIPVTDAIQAGHASAEVIKWAKEFAQWAAELERWDRELEYWKTNLEGLKGSELIGIFRKYKEQFKQLQNTLKCDSPSILLHQVNRLNEIYPAYHEGWKGDPPPGSPETEFQRDEVRKQIVITKKQMKWAIVTGNKVLESIPETQEELMKALDRSNSSAGTLHAMQAGNQIMMTVARSLLNLEVQMSGLNQGQAAAELERNHRTALMMNNSGRLMDGWDNRPNPTKRELNPIK